MRKAFSFILALAMFVIISCSKNGDNNEPGGIPNGAVDLGLSVYWAECNLGAETSYDYGDYYAWGETSVKSEYTLENYKFYKSGDYSNAKFTKYNFEDAKGSRYQLDKQDDAASVKLGGKWRIPTDKELSELYEKCTWKYTTRNGIKGFEVTSSINGNSIFLPGGSLRVGDHLVEVTIGVGYYWGSAGYVPTNEPDLKSVKDIELWANFRDVSGDRSLHRRWDGLSIRPVADK